MKNRNIIFRCSDDEKLEIESLAKLRNLSTSNFLRSKVFEDKKLGSEHLRIAIKIFMDISLDLSRVCSNLNQIAYSLNKNETIHHKDIKELIDEYYTDNKKLHNELKKFIKELSK